MAQSNNDKSRLDDAARAGWLYFIAGNTQDEIAKKLEISRPAAQRLVSLALEKRLITFRLEHPIAACMELSKLLSDQFELAYCEIVPTDPAAESTTIGIAEAAASLLEQRLRSEIPTIIAIGTGRAMRATAEQVAPMDCPNHQIVSLVGNISPDGSASFFDALTKLADLTNTRHYPIPLPVYASSPEELQQLLRLDPVRRIRALGETADLRLVGVGQMDLAAPLHVDGFLSREGLLDMMRRGAVGEITGWAIDAEGHVIEGGANARLTSLPVQQPPHSLAVGVARGAVKVRAIRAALRGRILNGLITDEATARQLLAP
jgi:DNA-binding transcriptional regulator LsrR (DeoR family)